MKVYKIMNGTEKVKTGTSVFIVSKHKGLFNEINR